MICYCGIRYANDRAAKSSLTDSFRLYLATHRVRFQRGKTIYRVMDKWEIDADFCL